jgi:cytochrome c biogenesis protein CcmG, thiol:disulfide interchange protein DsbE
MTETRAPEAHRPHTARLVAVVLAVLLALLVAVLATRDAATTRLSRSPLVGRQAPDLTADVLLNGDDFVLADERGRFVLVNFFATWCVPCQAEHDDLVRFANTHAVAGDASVVSVVFSDDEPDVRRFFERRGGDWPVLRDRDGRIATTWGVAGVPESYLIAPDGRVVAKIVGGVTFEFLEEQLARLLGVR